LKYWEHEFHRSNFICLGVGRFLEGEEAREAHYRWANIPASLIEQWMAERRQQDTKTEPRSATTAGLESA